MVAYRIDRDMTITRVEGTAREILHCGQVWACLPYGNDDRNDIWYDDEGIFKDDPIFAWIGDMRRIPLPVFILGAFGEQSCDPLIALEDVRFGLEKDQSIMASFGF